jgi:hypothetical protein
VVRPRRWKAVYLPEGLRERLKAEAHRRGLSIPEFLEELLRDLRYTICRAKPVDSKDPFGASVKVYFVECIDPDGHVMRAVVPGSKSAKPCNTISSSKSRLLRAPTLLLAGLPAVIPCTPKH